MNKKVFTALSAYLELGEHLMMGQNLLFLAKFFTISTYEYYRLAHSHHAYLMVIDPECVNISLTYAHQRIGNSPKSPDYRITTKTTQY